MTVYRRRLFVQLRVHYANKYTDVIGPRLRATCHLSRTLFEKLLLMHLRLVSVERNQSTTANA